VVDPVVRKGHSVDVRLPNHGVAAPLQQLSGAKVKATSRGAWLRQYIEHIASNGGKGMGKHLKEITRGSSPGQPPGLQPRQGDRGPPRPAGTASTQGPRRRHSTPRCPQNLAAAAPPARDSPPLSTSRVARRKLLGTGPAALKRRGRRPSAAGSSSSIDRATRPGLATPHHQPRRLPEAPGHGPCCPPGVPPRSTLPTREEGAKPARWMETDDRSEEGRRRRGGLQRGGLQPEEGRRRRRHGGLPQMRL
jgi:hypothetical protein